MSARPGILFVLNSLGSGGAERHVVSLVRGLDGERHRLSVAYLKRHEALLPELSGLGRARIFCCEVRRRLDLGAVRRLAAHIDADEVDLVVCTNLYSTLYGVLARLRARRPTKLLGVLHTTVPGSPKAELLARLYWPVLRSCDHLVYVCEAQRRYWRARGYRFGSDSVIHNGIDTQRFTDRYPMAEKHALRRSCGFAPDDYLIGLCGALRPEKAHGDLLLALAALHRRGLPARALLIGDGPERARIERRVAELGLSGHVALAGYQPDPRPYIAACDVMVLVSRAVETFSLAALESMALGRPVVLSRTGGAAEQVTDGVEGFLFEVGDVAALAERLAWLASPALRCRMGAAAARRVRERFAQEGMVAAFAARIESLLPGARAGASASAARDGSPPARARLGRNVR